jgi:hypothetical protein
MDQACTISGGSGSGKIFTTFTASGSSYALSYVDTLVGAINGILANGGNTDPIGPDSVDNFFPGNQLAGAEPIYQLIPDTTQVSSQTFDIATAGYVVDTIGGAVIVNTDSGFTFGREKCPSGGHYCSRIHNVLTTRPWRGAPPSRRRPLYHPARPLDAEALPRPAAYTYFDYMLRRAESGSRRDSTPPQ